MPPPRSDADAPASERVDQQAIRRESLSAVLQRVAAHGPRSRATLASETSLNKSTASSIVRELIDRGLLVETGELEHPGRVGRPATMVRFAGAAIAGVGIEINVDYVAVCALDLDVRLRFAERVEIDNTALGPAGALARVGAMASAAIDALEAEGTRVVGVTLAVPGLVDVATGTLTIAPNLGWRDVACAAELRRLLRRPDLPIEVDNEANLAAFAELWEGAANGLRDFICVSGAIGIGAGVFVDGRLLRGRHGFSGEIGHVTIDPEGPVCACGARGCLQAVAGAAALLDAAGIGGQDARTGRTDELVARARAGDARTLAALAEAARVLGIALGSAVNLLDPEAVVLGGYLAPLAEWLVEPVRAQLDAHVLGTGWEVLAGVLGSDAASRGAAERVLDMVMTDPARVGERAPASA